MPPPTQRGLLMAVGLLLTPWLLPGPAHSQTPTAAKAPTTTRVLYTLATRCSLEGGPAQACTVEAVDEGNDTLYHHRIGSQTISVRITQSPVTMSLQKAPGQPWVPMQSAGALFSTNSICFNNRALCVVNPNYLNSVREDRQDLRLQGRDLVKVHFGADGRVDATCYDAGCEVDFR